MNIEDLSIFGLYSQMENKVTAALLQVIGIWRVKQPSPEGNTFYEGIKKKN